MCAMAYRGGYLGLTAFPKMRRNVRFGWARQKLSRLLWDKIYVMENSTVRNGYRSDHSHRRKLNVWKILRVFWAP